MIEGYVNNSEFKYNTDLPKIDNKNIFLAIDGNIEKEYLNEIIDKYNRLGFDFINGIKDFISIYLYDKKEKKLLIINDRIGAKKVYYYQENNKLYFSNDLNKLTSNNKNINISCLSMYFRHHYIPEPYTIYQDIFKLEHGHYIVFNNGKVNNVCYWDIVKLFNERKVINDYNQVENELSKLINKKIKEYTKNKKNIGIYLSSGIDSSLVTSFYKELYPKNTNTFSIGFEIEEYNEANSSKQISEYLKTNHHELIIKNMDAKEIVNKIFDYYSEPFGDASAVATIILNEYAKKNKIKIALTGDGSDQLFCGAGVYDFFYKINKYSKILNPLHIRLNNKLVKNNRLFFLFSNVPKKYRAQIDFINDEKKIKDLFIDNGIKRFEYDEIKTNNLQEERMILDLDTFMAQRVLPKMCIAAKKNNIDIIPPYLSHDVIEYTFRIPHKYKYHNKIKKYILKQLLFKKIPSSFFSKKKKGFAIPVKEWLKTTLNTDLKRVSTKEYLNKQNIFNYEKVQSLINNIDNNSNLVWDYYMFQLWYENNIILAK